VTWQKILISQFGGPDVLDLTEESAIPEPGPGEVRIKVLAAGTGFTDIFIRRGRYPDYKGPVPFVPGYDIVGLVDKVGPGVASPSEGEIVADLCVVGGYTQYAIRPAQFLVSVPDGVDPAEAVCIPLAYLTAFQMLTRYHQLTPGATILAIGASGTVGTALLDLARHFGLNAIGTSSAANMPVVESFGAKAIDYRHGDFVATLHKLTAGVDAVFDAIGGAHFARSYACLAPGGLLVGYGSPTMADGREGLLSAGLGILRLKLWDTLQCRIPQTAREVVQHHLATKDPPRRVQGRHGCSVRTASRRCNPPSGDRPSAACCGSGGPHPHRRRRPRGQDRSDSVVADAGRQCFRVDR
jgi:NADPH:quinone reductase-like Zn-dependent oxidoreductase